MQQQEPVVAHQMTNKQLQELQYNQNFGSVETIPANMNQEVKIPAHEKHLIHVKTYVPQFNRETGNDESIKHQQSFYPADFERMEKEQAFAGMKVEILHDPKNNADDIPETASLTPKIVSSGAGAGTPLTEAIQNKDKKSVWPIFKSFFPDTSDEQYDSTTKDAMVAQIQERYSFLTDEAKTEDYAKTEIERLNAAGYVI